MRFRIVCAARGVDDGRIARTAWYHEVCAADKDGDDGGGGGENWEECWVLPESVYWKPIGRSTVFASEKCDVGV